ncbi:MaoC family dehydratase [Aurantiacibacter gangjinensis]|uniref:MaoC family dehydratase n=1 Tax=Aurantiacibacter gangjinensis TaxID=502682 RepID=UPI0019D38DCD|nr:MaoC family dehydratase [Aurantiacibacter gangjinensis]
MLYLDDLTVGDRFESEPYEMTEAAIIAFARDYDPQPFHVDPDAAQDTFFQGLAASGWHTAAITMRLMVQSVPFANGAIGAGGDLRWPEPTRPGDRLRLVTTIEDIIPNRSKPGRARVVALCQTLNQHDAIKQEFRPNLMAWKRGVDPAA